MVKLFGYHCVRSFERGHTKDLGIPGTTFSLLDHFDYLNITEEVQYCFTFVVIKHIFQ